MQVRDAMTIHPVTADVNTSIRDVAQWMGERGCGEIPVTDGDRIVGVVTDRDITCRAVALAKDPETTTVREVMTKRPARIHPEESVRYAIRLMEELQVRRLPVVDGYGKVVGIISMTDICRCTARWTAGGLLREVSRRREPAPHIERGPEVFPPYF